MKMCALLGLLCWMLALGCSFGKEGEVVKRVQFLSNDRCMEVNVDQAVFVKELSVFLDEVEKQGKVLFEGEDVGFQVYLTVEVGEKAPVVAVRTLPEGEAKAVELGKALSLIQFTPPVYYDVEVIFNGTVGKGGGEFAEVPSVIERHRDVFVKAEMAEQLNMVKAYAAEVCVPITAAYMRSVDPKFEGVRATGGMLKDLDFSKRVDVGKVLDQNSDYWRGMMEMSPGNCLVTANRAFLHAANGDLDHARRYLNMHLAFAEDDVFVTDMMSNLKGMIQHVGESVRKEIKRGIALHDQGQYDEARAVYEALLKVYPASAWATYEHWFSGLVKGLLKDGKKLDELAEGEVLNHYAGWRAFSWKVYQHDPLYATDVNAQGPEEVFLMKRRLEIGSLFGEGSDAREEWVKYAGIAFDLEVYPFSTELYWGILTRMDKATYGNRDLMDVLAYSFHKMGADEVVGLLNVDVKKVGEGLMKDRERRVGGEKAGE